MSGGIEELERRIAGLRENIARRKSQAGNHQHEGSFSDTSKHIAAAEKELRQLAIDYIGEKCRGHGWDALDVLERMTKPAAAPSAPAQPVREVQIVRVGDETRGKLQSLLENTIGTYISRSKLQELLKS